MLVLDMIELTAVDGKSTFHVILSYRANGAKFHSACIKPKSVWMSIREISENIISIIKYEEWYLVKPHNILWVYLCLVFRFHTSSGSGFREDWTLGV